MWHTSTILLSLLPKVRAQKSEHRFLEHLLAAKEHYPESHHDPQR
jgi:hypothetical protein